MARAKEIENLDCDADVLSGARLILQTRLAEICALRDAALDWSDIEGVHDMRVATRRLRSAARDFKPYLTHTHERRELKVFNAQIRTLAAALGAVRDLDVQLKSLEKLEAQATNASEGIEQFRNEREIKRAAKRHALVEVFREIEFEKLSATLAVALKDGVRGDDGTREILSFRGAAHRIIRNAYREFEEQLDALWRPRSVKRLHRLRIAAKRLRYALELFASCFEKNAENFADEIAEMQSSLGIVHDCDVWIDELTVGGRRKKKRNALRQCKDENGIREASVWLLLHFEDERASAFHKSLARWNEWERHAFGARLLKHYHLDGSAEDNCAK